MNEKNECSYDNVQEWGLSSMLQNVTRMRVVSLASSVKMITHNLKKNIWNDNTQLCHLVSSNKIILEG